MYIFILIHFYILIINRKLYLFLLILNFFNLILFNNFILKFINILT